MKKIKIDWNVENFIGHFPGAGGIKLLKNRDMIFNMTENPCVDSSILSLGIFYWAIY